MGLQCGIHDALAACEMHLMLTRLPDAKLTHEGYVPKLLREWSVDGLLINYTDHIPEKMLSLIHQYAVPSIWINSKQATDATFLNDLQAARDATEFLIAKGHQRVAYVDYAHGARTIQSAHYSALDRQAGYEAAMAAAGLQARVIRDADFVPAAAFGDFTHSWLDRDDAPTALVTYSDYEAIPILVTARETARSKKCVPEMVTFGDVVTRLMDQVIPTMLAPQYAMGRKAVAMLLEKIAQPQRPLSPLAIDWKLATDWDEFIKISDAGTMSPASPAAGNRAPAKERQREGMGR